MSLEGVATGRVTAADGTTDKRMDEEGTRECLEADQSALINVEKLVAVASMQKRW